MELFDFDKLNKNLILLKFTQRVSTDNKHLPETALLLDLYEGASKITNPVGNYVASVINMIVTHRRVVFAMSRDGVAEGVRNDHNHNSGFTVTKWGSLLAALYEQNIIKLIEEGVGRHASAYEVIHPDLLKVLQVNRDAQFSETMSFIKNKPQTATRTDLTNGPDERRYGDKKISTVQENTGTPSKLDASTERVNNNNQQTVRTVETSVTNSNNTDSPLQSSAKGSQEGVLDNKGKVTALQGIKHNLDRWESEEFLPSIADAVARYPYLTEGRQKLLDKIYLKHFTTKSTTPQKMNGEIFESIKKPLKHDQIPAYLEKLSEYSISGTAKKTICEKLEEHYSYLYSNSSDGEIKDAILSQVFRHFQVPHYRYNGLPNLLPVKTSPANGYVNG